MVKKVLQEGHEELDVHQIGTIFTYPYNHTVKSILWGPFGQRDGWMMPAIDENIIVINIFLIYNFIWQHCSPYVTRKETEL